ncbi:MAG: hypothetical protein KDJ38_07350, partial [Gammaproteobacteria bacterium]|nr:hypothetical protein [Gammaproteobacteria bacterium]
ASIDISIRAWARRDKVAKATVEEVDRLRLSFVTDLFKELGHSDSRAQDLAYLIYSYMMAVTLIDLEDDIDKRVTRATRLSEFLASNCPLSSCPQRENHPLQKEPANPPDKQTK